MHLREGLALWRCAGTDRAECLWGRCRLGCSAVVVARAERPDTLVPSCPACLVSAGGPTVCASPCPYLVKCTGSGLFVAVVIFLGLCGRFCEAPRCMLQAPKLTTGVCWTIAFMPCSPRHVGSPIAFEFICFIHHSSPALSVRLPAGQTRPVSNSTCNALRRPASDTEICGHKEEQLGHAVAGPLLRELRNCFTPVQSMRRACAIMPTRGTAPLVWVAMCLSLVPALAQQPGRTGRALLLDQRLVFRDGLLPRNTAAGMDGPYEVVRFRAPAQTIKYTAVDRQ